VGNLQPRDLGAHPAGPSAKTRRPRRIPLRRELRAIISRNGKPVVQFRKAWRKACRLAGVESWLFHDLRRTGVRNLIRAGVPRSIAMKISGHATESVFERYNIHTDKELGDALDAVSDYVAGLPTEPRVQPLRRAVSE
jgi:integrase